MRTKFIKRNKAQSVLEVGLLLGIVAMALMAMQIYVKRGVQGSLKKAVDRDPDVALLQYEPPYASSKTHQSGDSFSNVTGTGGSYRSFSNRDGAETTVGPVAP